MSDERKTSFEDELLDRALLHHRVEEPRAGLEDRLLARLETAERPKGSAWLKLAAVAVPAAVLIVAAVHVFRSPVTEPAPEADPPPVVKAVPPTSDVPQPPAPIPAPPEPRAIVPSVETVVSRPSTFPSSGDLSPQEALLVRFVRSAAVETLHQAAEAPPTSPLQFDELSSEPLHVEPLPAAEPLSAS